MADDEDAFYDDESRSNPARPSSALDNVTRQNLLNIVLERTRNANQKCLIHRLIYFGRLNPDATRNPMELGELYETFFRSTVGNFQTEPVSGLLLVYPTYFMHILEGPENVLFDVIEEGIKGINNIIQDFKVLVYISNVPGRLFSIWTFRVLSISMRIDGSKMQESFENSVTDAITLIYKLSNELLKFSKVQMKSALDQLTVKYSHLLVPQDLIETLLGHKELLTFLEFRMKYMLPIHVTLHEELVWPSQSFPPKI